MYNLDIIGLACVSKKDAPGRLVLLPDGRNPADRIDPHEAQLVVKTDEVEWIDPELAQQSIEGGMVITLPQCDMYFEGADTKDRAQIDLDTGRHDPFLQRLSDIDPSFDADDQDRTLVRFRIRRGQLIAYRYPSQDDENPDPAIVSRLKVPHDGPITIRIFPTGGAKPLEVKLKAGANVLLANTAPFQDELNIVSHFRIYENLSKKPVNFAGRPLVGLSNLRDLPTDSPFFDLASGSGDQGDCGNTGCCP